MLIVCYLFDIKFKRGILTKAHLQSALNVTFINSTVSSFFLFYTTFIFFPLIVDYVWFM